MVDMAYYFIHTGVSVVGDRAAANQILETIP